jgi:alkylhydroperoxidase family enzyme
MALPRRIRGRSAPTVSALVARLRDDVLTVKGVTPRALRERVVDGAMPADGPWAEYVTTIRTTSYRIVEETFQDLREQGCSEDAIYEMTIVAAMSAARQRLDAGLRACRTGGR